MKTSSSSRLVVENSLTIAPSSPAWNQWSVSGGTRHCSPGREHDLVPDRERVAVVVAEPCRRRRRGLAFEVEVDDARAAAEHLLLAGRAVERRMAVLGAGLAREEHELLRADAVGVRVDDHLEPELLEPGEPEVGDLDSVALLRCQHDPRGVEGLGGAPSGGVDLALRQRHVSLGGSRGRASSTGPIVPRILARAAPGSGGRDKRRAVEGA